MKKQKKIQIILFLLTMIMIVSTFTSCSAGFEAPAETAGGDYVEEDASGWDPGYSPEEPEAEPTSANDNDFSPAGRKIIKQYSYTIETQNFDESLSNIMSAVEPAEGYVLYSDIYAAGYGDVGPKRAQLQLRIPTQYIPRFREQLGDAGRITNQGESGEDITDRYYDTEMRIQSLESQLNRLSALYEKADIMADIIEIQTKIDDVIFQLEYLKGEMQRMDHYVDYSTITISLMEVRDFTPTDGVTQSLGDRIKNAFSQMMINLRRGAENFVVNIVYFLPGIIIFAVIVLIIILVIRSGRKRRKNYQNRSGGGYYQASDMKDQIQGPQVNQDQQKNQPDNQPADKDNNEEIEREI